MRLTPARSLGFPAGSHLGPEREKAGAGRLRRRFSGSLIYDIICLRLHTVEFPSHGLLRMGPNIHKPRGFVGTSWHFLVIGCGGG